MFNDQSTEETIYSGVEKKTVGLVTNRGYTIAEAARNLGIGGIMLSHWRGEQLKKQQDAFCMTMI